jgi:hypothetical protein
MRNAVLAVLALGWASGCGGSDGSGLIPPDVDSGEDSGLGSADGGADAAADATLDASPDATTDAGGDVADGPSDVAVDAPKDAPADVVPDASCDALGTPLHVHVDPVAGSDAPSSTGSGTTGGAASRGCAVKTLTRALKLLPVSAPVGTQIIVDVTADVQTGELFPIAVPANVEILAAAGATVRVLVPAGQSGFVLASAGSGLRALRLDGQGAQALHGVVVQAGANASVLGVDIAGFQQAGIRVQGGHLALGGGASLHDNGNASQAAPGLRVLGTATVEITGGTNAAPTSFSKNQGAGIDVRENASITLSGVVQPGGTLGVGTVLALANGASGLVIAQALVSAPPFPPESVIDGLVSAENTRSGVELFGGSAARVRNGQFVKNGIDGVRVAGSPNGAPGQDFDDISRIDLGTGGPSPSYGKNVVQDDNAPNQGVGICLALVNAPSSIAQTLRAAGNVFGASLDCSTSNPKLTQGPCAGSGNTPGTVGLQGALDALDVSMCRLN